jgi:hypothetical protein
MVVQVALRRRRLECPVCGASVRARYDRRPVSSRWRHLDVGARRVEVRAELRRLCCPTHGVRTEAVPFARPGAGFTRDFEDLVAWLATKMDKSAIGRYARIDWDTVGRICERVVADGLDTDRFDGLVAIGVDEVSWRKNHHYLTLDLVFWGEWEPPSRIEHRWPPGGGNPRALHQPYWFRPAPGWRRQNTDPWVFGTQMLYSNCRQGIEPMRSLPPGSVICFGSTLNYEFVLDTVFVIASAQPWTPADTDQLDVDEAFKVCTAESITAGGSTCVSCGESKGTGCTERHDSFTLYRGATFEEQVHGMYSFVPALPVTGGDPPRFARPVIHLPDLIKPTVARVAIGLQTTTTGR